MLVDTLFILYNISTNMREKMLMTTVTLKKWGNSPSIRIPARLDHQNLVRNVKPFRSIPFQLANQNLFFREVRRRLLDALFVLFVNKADLARPGF
nr:hypothetical protein [Candidatus Erwinia dacicola]